MSHETNIQGMTFLSIKWSLSYKAQSLDHENIDHIDLRIF